MKPLKLIVFVITCLAGTAWAADDTVWKQAISIPDFFGSTDSDGFSTYRYRTGYYPLYEHGDKYTGIEYLRNQFNQGSWSSFANQATLITKAINPRTGLGYNLNLGYNVENGYKLLTTDSQYGFRLTDSTTGELVVNRDRVETPNSLNYGIYYTLTGASIEQQLTERLTFVGMGGDMFFSDTNTRAFMRLKLIYDLIPSYGITAQLRYRQYHDSNTNVPNNYFNPGTYTEAMLAAGIKRRIEGWMLNGTAGLGQQRIDQDLHTTTKLLEFGATSPYVGTMFLRTRFGYSKFAEFIGPNYSYRYIMEELIFPF
ncbi:MAG: hypothetical protein WB870_17135 [Gallionellaceae bacterium]